MSDVRAADLTSQVVDTVRRWLVVASSVPADAAAERFSALLRDPDGLAFAVAFADRVVRPEDPAVAARQLDRLSRDMPASLPWQLKAAVAAGGGFGPLAPRTVVPVARKALRRLVQHLVVEAAPDKLGAALASAADGARLDLALLGEPVLGEAAARRRVDATRALLERDDVRHVSVPVASVVGTGAAWGADERASAAVEALTPLYELALASDPPKMIDLEVDEHRHLDLAIDVFTRLLDQPQLADLEAGIEVQAHVPDALASLQLLTDWARGRVARGGAPIRVRLTVGGVALEAVDAALHDWPVATHTSRAEADAALLRVLDHALRPVSAEFAHLGLVTDDPFVVAHAWTLAKRREVTQHLTIEMPLGTSRGLLRAVRAEVGDLVVRAPIVQHGDLEAAADHVVRHLAEVAAPGSALAATADLAPQGPVFDREAVRYRAAVAAAEEAADDDVPPPARRQDRSRPHLAAADLDLDGSSSFRNEPDTDPGLEGNRAWARRVLAASRRSDAGLDTIEAAQVDGADGAALVDELVTDAAQAGAAWGREAPSTRAELLELAADGIARQRAALVEVLVSETGSVLDGADPEVSAAVDSARHHAGLARGEVSVLGARHAPPRLTVVVPSWRAPLVSAAEPVLAALAAGSAVLLCPARESRRTAAVLAEVLWGAGVPRALLVLADLELDSEAGHRLVGHPAVDRVRLTGSLAEARQLRSWRPDLDLVADVPVAAVAVVTPSADADLAAADVVAGAFRFAGQAPSASRTAVLVGSAAHAERFRRQLVDAAASLRTGWPDDATTQVGPLIDPAEGAVLEALTVLAPGESWLVEPRQLDDDGGLWSPGVKTGVTPEAAARTAAAAAPVLCLVEVDDLDAAIDLQEKLSAGGSAALHSLDVEEVDTWLRRVRVGSLVVGRPTSPMVVRRRPAASWGRSVVGTAVAPGGPDGQLAQGSWWRLSREPHPSLRLTGVPDEVVPVIEAARSSLSFEQFDRVRTGAVGDERAWQAHVGVAHDASALGVERNVLRYRPRPVLLRLSSDADLSDLVRLLVAAARVRAPITVSSAVPVPASLVQLLHSPASPMRVGAVVVESDQAFLARASAGLLQERDATHELDDLSLLARATGSRDPAAVAEGDGDGEAPEADEVAVAAYRDLHVRLIGGDARALARAVGGSVDVVVHGGDVTDEGRVELLTFVREQSVTVTAHRSGLVDPELRDLRI
jgi:RHH-type proline utilization regulon transcriptional repressor/proline dehydrogenase/delta 1-pyrroline-5-carboxylate dehydrogenase